MGRRQEDYRFLPIEDAISAINQRVNLIGVVLETSIPKQTRGTDCFCTLKIVDESRPNPWLSVNIFSETMEKLPQVNLVGDIIQLSHVVMKTHASEVYALFNKKFSSFALFEGKGSTNFVPYQVSSNFHARDNDKKFIVAMRKWLTEHQLDTGLDDSILLREIKQGEQFNLFCKVLHSCEVTKDEWMVFVWDGNDCPPVPINSKLEEEIQNPLPSQLEPFDLPRDVLCTFPTVGTVLRVTVDRGNEKLGLHLLKTGKWVKFINLKCEVHRGLWHGVMMPFVKLCYLPDDHDIVLQCQKSYNERAALKWSRMPSSCFPWPSPITETDYPGIPFVTLMDILTYSEVIGKFRCVVRVIAVFPWQAEDFRSPNGTYRIRLTLEDPTARLHAYVYAEDGEEFFGGYPSVDVMKKQLNILLGVTQRDDGEEIKDAPRNPPWVQCCLKSYFIDKSDIWGTRNYRIFATKLRVRGVGVQ